jgi:hypothetical protein
MIILRFFMLLNGNLENMKWLLENNFVHDYLTFAITVAHRNLDNMKWFLENKFEHNNLTFFILLIMKI